MSNTEFYTVTMARVYAQQGHLNKAAEIYRYILQQEPGRKDAADALSRIEDERSRTQPEPEEELAALLGELLRLGYRYDRINRLRRLREDIRR